MVAAHPGAKFTDKKAISIEEMASKLFSRGPIKLSLDEKDVLKAKKNSVAAERMLRGASR